jgi:hypothetical protein
MNQKDVFHNVRRGLKPLVLFMALGKRHSDQSLDTIKAQLSPSVVFTPVRPQASLPSILPSIPFS